MQRIITVEGIGDVVVAKRRNCCSMRLTVHPEKGLHLSIPFRVSYSDAERFVFEHRDWIAKTLQEQKQKGVKRLFTPQSHFTCRSTKLQFSPTDAQKRILSARINNNIVISTDHREWINPFLILALIFIFICFYFFRGFLHSASLQSK